MPIGLAVLIPFLFSARGAVTDVGLAQQDTASNNPHTTQHFSIIASLQAFID
jgi:hypothetical protein